MLRNTRRGVTVYSRWGGGAVALSIVVSSFGLTGCGIVNTVTKVVHDVEGNRAIIDAFTTKLKSGEPKTFEATYITTGSSPATVVYAVKPPDEVSFVETSAGGPAQGDGATDLYFIVNASGEYSCSPASGSGAGSGSRWSCTKLGSANAAVQSGVVGFYTPAHWVNFLKAFSIVAGLAGDSVKSSKMTVNGFDMSCVDLHAKGIVGLSTICTAAQGILGYVKVATDSSSFELKAYSTTPPASLFELPPGATVAPLQTVTT